MTPRCPIPDFKCPRHSPKTSGMVVTIVTVVPEPSTSPTRALSVKIRDRHDFETLCEKVRWQLKDSAVRYPPGSPIQFVFFDHQRNALRVADGHQLARALSLAPNQLDAGCLVLYIYEASGNSRSKPLPTNDGGSDAKPVSIPETSMQTSSSDANCSAARIDPAEEVRQEMDVAIGQRPAEISHHAWNVIIQVACGQISSFPQLALALSSIAGLNDDTEYPALQYCLRTMTKPQQQTFFQSLLPFIARLALAEPVFNRTLQHDDDSLTISRLQASSIVANIFLCSLTASADARLHRLTMSGLFRSNPYPAVTKIDAVLHYLSSVPALRSRPGSVRMTRVHCDMSPWTMARLMQCQQSSKIVVEHSDLRSCPAQVHLEQVHSGHFGAAALGPETTSDILRLFEAPELLAVSTLCEPLLRYDSVVITGARRMLCLSGEGAQIRIRKFYDDDAETTVVLFKSTPDNAARFHPRTVMDEILQAMAAMLATDTSSIATKSSEIPSPHRIDLDRDFIVKIIASMASNRELIFYTEGDGRMSTYGSIAKMLNGVRVADLVRFLNGYRPSMGSLWTRLQEFLAFDRSVVRGH